MTSVVADVQLETAARRLYEVFRVALLTSCGEGVSVDCAEAIVSPWEFAGADHRAAWIQVARLQRQAPRLHVVGVATDADVARARAFFASWDLKVRAVATVEPRARYEGALRSLAQAFADERATIEDEARYLGDELARAGIRLRRAVGVVSDLARLEAETHAVLDDYAGGAEKASACGAPMPNASFAPGLSYVPKCGLLRGHAGPCGVTR